MAVAPTLDAVEPLFRKHAADVALVLEPRLAQRLADGTPAHLLLVSDASDPNTGSTMAAYATQVIAGWQAELGAGAGGVRLVPQVRMRYNPTLESVNLFVPGLIALILTIVSAMMTAISITREKETGTMEMLLVSPLRPVQIVVGKVAPYVLLGFVDVLLVLGAARTVFHMPLRGSVVLLLSASVLYALVGLALGVLFAAVTTSQRTAMFAALVGTMLPNTLLSGMIFPIASLPAVLQPVTNIVPARWFIVIARGIMLKGAGIAHLWQELLVLTTILVVLMTVATRRFHARLD